MLETPTSLSRSVNEVGGIHTRNGDVTLTGKHGDGEFGGRSGGRALRFRCCHQPGADDYQLDRRRKHGQRYGSRFEARSRQHARCRLPVVPASGVSPLSPLSCPVGHVVCESTLVVDPVDHRDGWLVELTLDEGLEAWSSCWSSWSSALQKSSVSGVLLLGSTKKTRRLVVRSYGLSLL